jgi:probable blue pigment (indigoidine) exporter
MSASSSPASARTVLALILAAACWGIGTVVSKRAVAEIPALTLLPIQLAASLGALVVLMRWRQLPFRDSSASPILGPLGILNPGLAYALSLLGLAHITASLSVTLWAIEPLLILFLAGWLLRERIGPPVVALSLVAAGGMLLVIYQPGGAASLLGVVLTLAGVACCATYTVGARRWLSTAVSTAQVVAAQQAYALGLAIVLSAVAWLVDGGPQLDAVTPAGWASAIASGTLYYGLAYWLYLSALRDVPASTASASFYLIPVFGVAGGVTLLGESLQPSQWLGVAVVMAAIFLIWRKSSAPDPQLGPTQEQPTSPRSPGRRRVVQAKAPPSTGASGLRRP